MVVDLAWLGDPGGLVMALHLGVIATALAYALFSKGLTTTPAPTAATLTLTEPLTAAVAGILILGEQPGPIGYLGMAAIAGGLLLAARSPGEETA